MPHYSVLIHAQVEAEDSEAAVRQVDWAIRNGDQSSLEYLRVSDDTFEVSMLTTEAGP